MIIIGNGLVANAFIKSNLDLDFILFASGVSDSKNASINDFDREKKLFLQTVKNYPNKAFVYFSTCSIYDPDSVESIYVKHKLNMEQLIKTSCNEFIIFRVSNIVGISNNKNTIFNFLLYKIKSHEKIKIWKNAYRNFIDIDIVVRYVSFFLKDFPSWKNKIINIASIENTSVLELVNLIINIYSSNSEIELLDKGSNYKIPIEDLIIAQETYKWDIQNTNMKYLIQKYGGIK